MLSASRSKRRLWRNSRRVLGRQVRTPDFKERVVQAELVRQD